MEKYNIVSINKLGYPRINAIIKDSIYKEVCRGCSYNDNGTCSRLMFMHLTTLCSLINNAVGFITVYKCILRSITLYSIINSEFTKDGINNKGR